MSSLTNFDLGDLIDESCEQSGLDPAALTHRHLRSITRSLQLLFIDLETDGANAEYRMETQVYTLGTSKGGIVLDSDTIDVTQAALVIDGKPTPLGRSTREDFHLLSFPTNTGSPQIFYLSKSDPAGDDVLPTGVTAPPATNETPILRLWPITPTSALGSTVQISVTRIRQHAMPTAFGDTLDTRRNWLPTLCAGLAAAIANKYNPAEWERLNMVYTAMKMRRVADEDHGPVRVGWRGPGWGRSRRH
jgi:hypothetical protein